jgi:hypothetical protein
MSAIALYAGYDVAAVRRPDEARHGPRHDRTSA